MVYTLPLYLQSITQERLLVTAAVTHPYPSSFIQLQTLMALLSLKYKVGWDEVGGWIKGSKCSKFL